MSLHFSGEFHNKNLVSSLLIYDLEVGLMTLEHAFLIILTPKVL
jgi:hypothetical protein